MKREKRQRKLIEVKFLEDFATKKAGETASYEPSLACNLISRKVAVVAETETPEAKPVIKEKKKVKKNEKDN